MEDAAADGEGTSSSEFHIDFADILHFCILRYNLQVVSNFAISHQFRKHSNVTNVPQVRNTAAIVQHFRNHYIFAIITHVI